MNSGNAPFLVSPVNISFFLLFMKTVSLFVSTFLFSLVLVGCTHLESPDAEMPNDSFDDTNTSGYTSSEGYSQDDDVFLSNPDTTMPADNSYQTALPAENEEVAVISTRFGDITVRFFPEEAPKAVENFLTHAKDGYYDDLMFHRVMDQFMIQGGDPLGNGTGGESIWQEPFEDEFDDKLHNIRGALSMANAGPRTNGSQFFINQVPNLYLDNRHTVFGQVIDGMDVVDQITAVETDASDKPVEPVTMNIRVVEYSELSNS